jgi:hypothetical protein
MRSAQHPPIFHRRPLHARSPLYSSYCWVFCVRSSRRSCLSLLPAPLSSPSTSLCRRTCHSSRSAADQRAPRIHTRYSTQQQQVGARAITCHNCVHPHSPSRASDPRRLQVPNIREHGRISACAFAHPLRTHHPPRFRADSPHQSDLSRRPASGTPSSYRSKMLNASSLLAAMVTAMSGWRRTPPSVTRAPDMIDGI